MDLSGPQRNRFDLGDLVESKKLRKGRRNLGIVCMYKMREDTKL